MIPFEMTLVDLLRVEDAGDVPPAGYALHGWDLYHDGRRIAAIDSAADVETVRTTTSRSTYPLVCRFGPAVTRLTGVRV